MNKKSIFKSFEVIEKESSKGNKYYILRVIAQNDKSAEMFMTESQKDLYEIFGAENCSVDIAIRKSKLGNEYKCVAFKIGDDVFDFFPKDRAFLVLAERVAK